MTSLFDLRIRPARAVGKAWWALPLRLIVGYGFIAHGWAKLARGPEHFTGILHALHMPAPALLAWATILTELIGGFAVLAGAFVPLAAAPMAIVLLVAIVTVHLPNGFSSIKLQAVTPAGARFGQPGYETDLLYLAALLALVLGGSGPFSVDALLQRRRAGLDRGRPGRRPGEAGPRPGSRFTIDLHRGDRRALTPLFTLADESALQVSSYIDLGEVLVAREGDGVIGCLQLVEGGAPGERELKSMAVQEAARRRGVATALIAAAVARCRTQDVRRLVVATAAADIDNLRFYQRRGFRFVRIVRDVFTAQAGYAEDARINAIPLRDQVWLDLIV